MIHIVDAHVGKCIRHRRLMEGKTQQELAQAVGIKFQQIQKYETGKNRVSASRLWDIAIALNVPVSFFFEGLDQKVQVQTCSAITLGDMLTKKESLEMLRYYYSLPDKQRLQLLNLVREMSRAIGRQSPWPVEL